MNWKAEAGKAWKGQRERRARLILSLVMLVFRVTRSPRFSGGARNVDDDVKSPSFEKTLYGPNKTHLWARFGPLVANLQPCLRETQSLSS